MGGSKEVREAARRVADNPPDAYTCPVLQFMDQRSLHGSFASLLLFLNCYDYFTTLCNLPWYPHPFSPSSPPMFEWQVAAPISRFFQSLCPPLTAPLLRPRSMPSASAAAFSPRASRSAPALGAQRGLPQREVGLVGGVSGNAKPCSHGGGRDSGRPASSFQNPGEQAAYFFYRSAASKNKNNKTNPQLWGRGAFV